MTSDYCHYKMKLTNAFANINCNIIIDTPQFFNTDA